MEASWGLLEVWSSSRWRVRRGLLFRILHDFPDIIRNIIRNIRNDMRKEIRIMILLKPPGGEYRRRSFLISAALWLGKKF